MARASKSYLDGMDTKLVIPDVEYGIPYRRISTDGSWPRLSGNAYILARLRRKAWEPGKPEPFFRIRLVRQKSTAERLADVGPVVWIGSIAELTSWQYDHDLYFGRTEAGRDVLRLYGLGIDKFRSASHPAHNPRFN